MKKSWIAVCFMFLFSGCFMEPYHQAFDEDAGPYPEKYLDTIKAFIADYLENPESVTGLEVIKPPEKIIIEDPQESVSLQKGHQVWETFVTFDAKNRRGKVVRDFHVFWIRNNRIVAYDYKKPDLAYRFQHRFDPEPEEDAAGTAPEKPATE